MLKTHKFGKEIWMEFRQQGLSLNSSLRMNPDPLSLRWKWVWRIDCPQKLRFFLWLTLHERLAVNEYRYWIGAATSNMCDRCNVNTESIIHMLRDCPTSKIVWENLVPSRYWLEFFALPLRQWLRDNVRMSSRRNISAPWSSTFVADLWHIWKARNEACFHQKRFYPIIVYRQILSYTTDMQLRMDDLHGLHLDPVNGRWFRPPPGYVKLNVDGSVRDGNSAYGGLLRNWVIGFGVLLVGVLPHLLFIWNSWLLKRDS